MTHQEILEIAKQTYFPGMVVRSIYGGRRPFTIKGTPLIYQEGDSKKRIVVEAVEKTDTLTNTFAIYGDGEWSEIIQGNKIIYTYEIY